LKLSKTSWILLAVGVFIIMFVGLGAVGFKQANQQDQLNEELTLAQLELQRIQLEQLAGQQEVLGNQLSQTLSQLETAKVKLSPPAVGITSGDILFDVAAAHGVTITEIKSSILASDELEGITCSVLSLMARAEGDVPDLIDFIIELNGDLPIGVIKSVAIGIPEATSEDKSSADIQLIIYTYQGE
jgi:hypothetical protein